MTKWIYRAVGTVGVAAGGVLLLAGGAAQADGIDAPANDLRGSLDGFFTPSGGSDIVGAVTRDLAPVQQLGFLGALPLDPAAGIDPAALEAQELPAPGAQFDLTALQQGGPGLTGNAVGDLLNGAGDPLGALTGGQQAGAGQAGAPAGGLPLLGDAPLGLGGGTAAPAGPAGSTASAGSTAPAGQGDFAIAGLGGDDLGALLPPVIGDTLAAEMATEAGSSAALPVVGGIPLAGLTGDDSPLSLLNTLGVLGSQPLLSAPPAATKPAPAPAPAPAPTRQPAVSPTADDGGNDQATSHRPFSTSSTERPVAGEDADFS